MHATRWMTVLVFLVLVLAQACTPTGSSTSNAPKTSAEVREDFLALDYNAALAQGDFITLTEAHGMTGEDAWVRVYANLAAKQIAKLPVGYELSDREYGALIGWRMPGGEINITSSLLMMMLGEYIHLHKCAPASAAELVPMYATSEGLAELRGLAPAMQLQRLAPVINPVTGKVYDSFTNPQWVLGGVDVEIITDPQELQRRFKEYMVAGVLVDDKGAEAPCNKIVVTTFYGEQPDSVLCRLINRYAD